MASVRFICGTTDLHRQLEARIADYVQMEDSILFAACFDANGAVFEPLFGEQDAIISDALNHASIIDGIRLSKAKRFRFANGDMNDLESAVAGREGGPMHAASSSSPMVCFPWTAISPTSHPFASSPTNMVR